MKKKNKKLPKYVLGTMNKYPLGYQPSRGIGDSSFSVTPGLNFLQPEVDANRRNIPQSIAAHAGMLGSFGYNMASNMGNSAALTGASVGTTTGTTAGSSTAPAASGGSSASSTALNAVGKAAGVAAALYGAAGITSDIISAGDHRTSSDMALEGSISRYTTPGGNSYNVYGNPNASLEKKYASQKHTLTTIDLMGHGAAFGGGLGGAIWGGYGALIGTAAGLLGGGIAGLAGVGDNSDEVNSSLLALGETNANRNRMEKAVAESKDMERAANGRIPVYSAIGKINKKATARVSSGEVIGNFEDGYVSRVPGNKNNKDSKFAALKDSDFVISNKYGLSDYAAQTGDYIGALNMLLELLHNKYKNGRLPGFANGEYIAPAISGLYSLLENNKRYNEAEESSKWAPNNYIEDTEGARAVNELANLRFDANPYLTDAERALRRENWNVRRQVGLGLGGRAIAQNANFLNYLNSIAGIRAKEQEMNNGYTLQHAQARANYGKQKQLMMTNAMNNQFQWQQQANAAKEHWLAQYGQNRIKSFADTVRDMMDTKRYNESLDIQRNMLKLYGDLNARENYKVFGNKEQQPASQQTTTAPQSTGTISPYIARPQESYTSTPVYRMNSWWNYPYDNTRYNTDPQYWKLPAWGGIGGSYKCGKLPKYEDGDANVDMGPKKKISTALARLIVKGMKKEKGLSGYDPMANLIVPGIGLGKLINWYRSIPQAVPERIQNMDKLIDNPSTSINDPNIPTFMDFIKMSKYDPKGASAAYDKLIRSGLIGL